MKYAWLSGPTRGPREVFGLGYGLPLPFLLRHGVWQNTSSEPFQGITLDEYAAHIRKGGMQFYVAAVEAGGTALDLASTFFMVEACRYLIVVGSELLRRLEAHCCLSDGHVIPIAPARIQAHAWPYEITSDRKCEHLYTELRKELGVMDFGYYQEVMRRLCERWPVRMELPQMYAILPSALLCHTGSRASSMNGRITVSLGPSASVRTRLGDVPASTEFFANNPLLSFQGFLVPSAAAPLFRLPEACEWPAVACVSEVALEWIDSDPPDEEAEEELDDMSDGDEAFMVPEEHSGRLHWSALVLTTKEVLQGAPILIVIYQPELWSEFGDPEGTEREGGDMTGWAFLHTADPDVETDMYFFRDVLSVDSYVEQIIERAEPGLYIRESPFAPFEQEEIDDGEEGE